MRQPAADVQPLIVFCSGAQEIDELLAGIGESVAGIAADRLLDGR